ncbi:hypothetical protein PVAP13_1NG303500 [Panicum virgatum]|uniref:Uncharacterized protein n=1 Tax=Panicum virgatum TaxID=38727 RepID=A0A8T0X2I3_PANVG|nr:hypothetical protein PVAP13_1NG303500 [Panicum virgatum]
MDESGGESGSWPASLLEGKAVARQGQGSGAGADARIHYRDRRRAAHVEVPRDWTTPGAPPSLLSPDFVAGSGRPSTAVKNPVTARPGAHAARSSGRHLAVNGSTHQSVGLCYNLPVQERALCCQTSQEYTAAEGGGAHAANGETGSRGHSHQRSTRLDDFTFVEKDGAPSTAAYAWFWSCGPFHQTKSHTETQTPPPLPT